MANSWLRVASCGIVAAVAVSLLGAVWPFVWLVGLAAVVLIDRAIFARLLKQCDEGRAPARTPWLIVWTIAQSAYGNIIAALLWFAPYAPGETLAVIYICGGLANAAATLRPVLLDLALGVPVFRCAET
ncbi:MAG: hypothetical protein K2X34_06380, partial [Hyphomonadaceae bacterium]|nr:hypothetical protein [Hyphomonadaceae bacterium]